MRFLLKVNLPVEEGNDSITNGTLPVTINSILSDIKPETVYFGLDNGMRTVYIFLNMNDPSDIVKYAEPWYLAFNADIEFVPVMNPDDLQKGAVHFENVVKKYHKK
jgi:hypothetical protein